MPAGLQGAHRLGQLNAASDRAIGAQSAIETGGTGEEHQGGTARGGHHGLGERVELQPR